jgi:hypothetical protein
VITKIVNALRPSFSDAEGTGTYADGLFASALVRQGQVDIGSSLRSSYGQDYHTAQKLSEPPRAHS